MGTVWASFTATALGAILLAMTAGPAQAASVGANAVVLVNSHSANYLDFQHFIQPYLDNFGFPYTVQDISTNVPSQSISNYAVIIIGHSQLDTNHAYLNTTAQASLSLAVSNGTGVVNFDNDLAVGSAPRYQFVQDIFGFSYGAGAGAFNVTLPPTEASSQMHFITARHPTNDTISFRSDINMPGIGVPAGVTTLALSGGEPLVAIRKYGQGRAVQWGSYDWMVSTVLGPVDGLDDVIWRGVVWAARKPFVMRGMPNLVSMRMDDSEGPFWWAHTAIGMGFKPFITFFLGAISDANAADLQGMVTNGNATASIHSITSSTMFYFDHQNETSYSDIVQSNNFYTGTQWHLSHGIPISKVCVAHYSEMGPNAFAGIKAWGMEFFPTEVVPGTVEYATPGAPWVVAGPYRLYETPQPGQVNWPTYYADWLVVPGHPEFNGQFFNVYSEARDLSDCGEWCPANNDVAGSISRGTGILKRALDSMMMATLFSHEWYIHPTSCCNTGPAITTNNWFAILQSITNNLAAYSPIYVTLDYASQYVRATRTSRLVSSAVDPGSGQVTATFSGYTDMDTIVYVFTGADNAISSTFGAVPAFALSATNAVVVSGPPAFFNEPSSQTNNAGTTATFSVEAGGALPLSYEWVQNGTNALSDAGGVSGAGSAALTISNVLGGNAGSYTVVVTNASGMVTSTPPAVLTVVDPIITSQPVGQTNWAGTTVVLSIAAYGTAPTYQWLKNGAPISGATLQTLSLINVSDSDAGSYSVTVSNAYGSVVSSNAMLAIFYLPTANDDSYGVTAGTTLDVSAPGVLGNDTVEGGGSLTAMQVGAPMHGTLSLNPNGGFTYTPLTNYVGTDSFTYEAVSGPTNSGVATVTISVTSSGVLFQDGFARLADPGPLSPWVAQLGSWAVTGGALKAGANASQSYGYAYLASSWTNYSVEGQIQFSSRNAWGGGIGGRLNPATGAHYAAWVYPDGSPGGSNVLKLIKFQTWTSFGYNGLSGAVMSQASLVATGTNWHTVKLAFHGHQTAVFYDGNQVMSVTDVEALPYSGGGISADMWTSSVSYTMSVADVIVRPLVVDDSYSGNEDTTLAVGSPGVLGNDTAVYGTNLTAALVSGPTNGTLNLGSDGGFTYSPATNYYGSDSFSYEATQGSNNLGMATVTVAVVVPDTPVIISAPASRTNNAGTTALFSAGALGASPLGYQWFWSGTNALSDGGKVSGARNATLAVSNVLGGDAGSYTVVVTNALGSVTSAPAAVLTVIDPIMTSQPVSQTNAAGTTALFSAGALGTSPLAYRWFWNGTNALSDGGKVGGARSATLAVSNVLGGDAGSYTVVVTNAMGSMTSAPAAVLTVIDPIITSQPASQTNALGTTVLFCVGANGTSPLYQWFKGGTTISGATNATLTLAAVSAADAASYSVVVSDMYGSVTSRVAELALPPEPTIEAVRLTNGVAVITWSSVAGQAYQVQYRDGLTGTNWHDVLPAVMAGGPVTTVTNALGSATQRFYRVILAPPAVPLFVITSVCLTNGIGLITWNSLVGHTYRLQYKNTLLDPTWQSAPPDLTAIGTTTTTTNTIGGANRRFYRVMLVQATAPRPLLTSISLTNGVATIVCSSVSGQGYRLQYKASLNDTNWNDVTPDVTATGPATTLTNAAGNSVRRFYRVALAP